MYKLLIEDLNGIWRIADLGDDKPAMNYQANNIAELKDRQANYSQALKLPPTKNNCLIFGMSDSFDVVSVIPYKKLNCRLFSNDSILAGPGSTLAIVKTNDSFETQILGGNADFFDTLNKPMSELDLGYVNYGEADLTNQSFATGEFYRYCLCTTVKGGANYVSPLERDAFPMVLVMPTFEKIITQNGYSLEFDGVMHTYATTICSMIPHNQYMTEFNASCTMNYIFNLKNIPLNQTYYFPVEIVSSGLASLSAFGTSHTDRGCQYYARESGNITIKASLIVSSTNKCGNVGLLIKNVTQDTITTIYNQQNGPFTHNGNTTIEVNKDDEIQVMCFAHNLSDVYEVITGYYESGDPIYLVFPDSDWNIDVFFSIEFIDIEYKLVPINGKLYLAENIGFDTQFDFVKAVAQLFGFTFLVDNDTKIVRAYTMKKLYDNKVNAKDWSAKLHDVESSTEYAIAGYAQNNFIRFEDNASDNILDKGNFEVNNETLDVWKDLFTIKFEAGLDNLTSDGIVANIPIQERKTDENGSSTYEFIGGKPHIVIIKNTTPVRQPPRPPKYVATHAKAQDFVNLYYFHLKQMLTNARWKEEIFNLTDEDIEEFDQFVPVYIQKYGAYFYVNKIKNFVSGELTKCELVKL
jgi:hypothetical protein